MSERVRDFLSQSWVQISVEATIAGALVIWELVSNGRFWPEALFLGLVEFAVLFFLMGRFCTPSVRRRVHDWLDSIGYTVETKQSASPDFWLIARAGSTAIDVRRQGAPADHSVTIASAAEVPDVLRQSLASMDPETRHRVLKPIARELLHYGLDVDLAQQLSAPGGPVIVSETLSVANDLTEAEFERTVDGVTRGSKLLTSLLSDVAVSTV